MSQKSTKKGPKSLNFTLVAVTGLVGFITIVITVAAILVGLWLDAEFGTRPRYTLILTIASLPVTLTVMFLVTRWSISRMMDDGEKEKENSEE